MQVCEGDGVCVRACARARVCVCARARDSGGWGGWGGGDMRPVRQRGQPWQCARHLWSLAFCPRGSCLCGYTHILPHTHSHSLELPLRTWSTCSHSLSHSLVLRMHMYICIALLPFCCGDTRAATHFNLPYGPMRTRCTQQQQMRARGGLTLDDALLHGTRVLAAIDAWVPVCPGVGDSDSGKV